MCYNMLLACSNTACQTVFFFLLLFLFMRPKYLVLQASSTMHKFLTWTFRVLVCLCDVGHLTKAQCWFSYSSVLYPSYMLFPIKLILLEVLFMPLSQFAVYILLVHLEFCVVSSSNDVRNPRTVLKLLKLVVGFFCERAFCVYNWDKFLENWHRQFLSHI